VRRPGRLALALLMVSAGTVPAQTLPGDEWPVVRPEYLDFQCPERPGQTPSTDAEAERFAMRARYAVILPALLARVGDTPASEYVMPVDGLRVSDVANTFGADRGNRPHDGLDMFAPRNTPVRAAAPGFVYRIDDLSLGGLSVTILGDGGIRYFYTHFESVPDDLREGQYVAVGDLIGYVGNSGNAVTTPTHLHFGVYEGEGDNPCGWAAFDPMPRMVDRP
jgi:murein DD-endopeptidase MepM/ murein hydrolase activator NlpD